MTLDRILDGVRLLNRASNKEDVVYKILSIDIDPGEGPDPTRLHLNAESFFEFVKDKNYQELVHREPKYYKNWTKYWLDLDGVMVFCLVECKEGK